MNKKEIRTQVHALLENGAGKSEVFAQLVGKGMKDSQLAYTIAAYVDPERHSAHRSKVNVLIGIMFVQALLVFVVGFGLGSKIGPAARWIVAGLLMLIPILFAWGFHTYKVGAYNGYILLSLTQAHKSFDGFAENPVLVSIVAAVNIGLIAYVWYVRQKLFPDFAFITPHKIKGEYVFSS